jgi:hypothetical protein
MTRPACRPAVALAVALAAALLAAGCGATEALQVPQQTRQAGPPTRSLDTSLVSAAGTWAVTVMGGSAAQHNNFWQLFIRPPGSSRWKLVTPPGTADNGGLVLAAAGESLITAFRPSQYLTFTPLTETRNGGQAWSALSPVTAALASAPDALAIDPASGRLLALLASGAAEQAAPGYSAWKTITSGRALAATPPGQQCELKALTAASFTPSGMPLLGGTCAHPGTAGIFADRQGTWQAAGPAIPAALARQDITVQRLTQTRQQILALLEAGRGRAGSLLAASSADNGAHWMLSPPLPLDGAALTSASFGADGTAAVVLTGDRGETITGVGKQWRRLPALPPGTATLAVGPAGIINALAVHRARLTVWQPSPGGRTWTTTQTIDVPILFGSSG